MRRLKDWLESLYYRWRCPGGGASVRSCIGRGECGCDNAPKGLRP